MNEENSKLKAENEKKERQMKALRDELEQLTPPSFKKKRKFLKSITRKRQRGILKRLSIWKRVGQGITEGN